MFFRSGYKSDGSIKYYSQCKDCVRDKHNECNRLWKLNNPDKAKECSRKYWEKIKSDPEKLQRIKDYRSTLAKQIRVYNPDKAKIIKNRYKEELHDEYIKKLLISHNHGFISAKDITTDMIIMKRQQLILTRKLRNHE
jgi:hypothetical protein